MTAPDRPTRHQVDADATIETVAGLLEQLAEPSTVHGKWILGQMARSIRAALAARTPQPAERAECPSCDGTEWACYVCQTPHEGWLYEAPRAPAPAVPDGEDAPDVTVNFPRSGCPLCGSTDRHRHGQAEWQAGKQGEDVPARLDAAADVLGADGLNLGPVLFRRLAAITRAVGPEVRAAVAAALAARPTEREK